VLAFCRSRTRNASDAEDATQTTFMYALTALQRGVVPEFELAWLLRIADNVCHSMRRRAYRRYERDELPLELGDSNRDPALVADRLSTLADALETLPETQRRAILLREWRGLSYEEIAERLETSHAAVETLLFRARRSLAKHAASVGTGLLPYLSGLVRWLLGSCAGKAAAVTAATITLGAGLPSDVPRVQSQERTRTDVPVGGPRVGERADGTIRPGAPAVAGRETVRRSERAAATGSVSPAARSSVAPAAVTPTPSAGVTTAAQPGDVAAAEEQVLAPAAPSPQAKPAPPLAEVTEPVTRAVEPLAPGVVETLEPVLPPIVTDVTEDVTDVVDETVPGVVEDLTGDVSELTEDVTGVVAPVLEGPLVPELPLKPKLP
jgi:RNA polymerase sigma-70 factor (ECF subfamily)